MEEYKKKPELLAPACDMKGLRAVINAGADAVYLGGQNFGARAFAGNFDNGELIEAIDIAHLYGVKVHLTLNTLIKEKEFGKIYDFLSPLYEEGLDAVLVQDLGIFNFISNNFTGLPIHASTQLSITDINGMRFLERAGVKRAVLARELSLNEIREIRKNTDLEIETFIHGALCYSYSGKCLMSSMLGGRSGNRGRCAQPCRLNYTLYDDCKRISGRNPEHLLSPRDLCALDLIPALAEAGIDSFKIEGRMKRPEYAAGVTALYRKYIDLYFNNLNKNCIKGCVESNIKNYIESIGSIKDNYDVDNKAVRCIKATGMYRVSESDRKLITGLFNRDGFTEGYLLGEKGPEMMSFEKARLNADSEFSGLYEEIADKYIKKNKKIPIKGHARIVKNQPSVLTFSLSDSVLSVHKIKGACMTGEAGSNLEISPGTSEVEGISAGSNISVSVYGEIPVKAENTPVSSTDVKKRLSKLGATCFEVQSMEVESENDVFISVRGMNELRRRAADSLYAQIIDEWKRPSGTISASPGKSAKSDVAFDSNSNSCSDVFSYDFSDSEDVFKVKNFIIEVSNMEQALEAVASEAVDIIIAGPAFEGIYKDKALLSSLAEMCKNNRKRLCLAAPFVIKGNAAGQIKSIVKNALENELISGFEANDLSSLEIMHDLKNALNIAGQGLYSFNLKARDFLKHTCTFTNLPYELNFHELMQVDNPSSIMTVYGYQPLMITENCLMKNTKECDKSYKALRLQDRKGKYFHVKCACDFCYNIIYNSVPLSLYNDLGHIKDKLKGPVRLNFTIETNEEVRRTIKAFADKYFNDRGDYNAGTFTKGHFVHGVY